MTFRSIANSRRRRHKKRCCYSLSIEAIGRFVGLARNGEPIDAMSVAEREKILEDLLKQTQQAEAASDMDGFSLACYRFYSSSEGHGSEQLRNYFSIKL